MKLEIVNVFLLYFYRAFETFILIWLKEGVWVDLQTPKC